MKPFDVIGFGALNVDRLGMVNRVSVNGETEVISEKRTAGGSAANTLAALGRLGLRVGCVGSVGDDAEGKLLLSAFDEDRVDTSLITKKHGSSGTLFGVSDSHGHRSLYIYPGVNSGLVRADLPAASATHARFVHLSSFVSAKQLDIQIQWVSHLNKSIPVTLAPGVLYSRLGLQRLQPLLSRTKILFLTQEELAILLGKKSVSELFRIGIECVAVTRGALGSRIMTKELSFGVPATKINVVDATGAGDAFIAGFLWGEIYGWSLRDCAQAGNVLAGFALGAVGARTGLPTLVEFEKKLPQKHSILIIGGGGREHAIGWKLKQSPQVGTLYFAPGNAGTGVIGENVAIDPTNVTKLMQFAKRKKIDFTVVGPDAALAAGITDRFRACGLMIFGPSQKAARLETSKVWSTMFMKRHRLPCPRSEVFDTVKPALSYVIQLKGNCVVKADGLCQGKGVFVCSSVAEAARALKVLMTKKQFGDSGSSVVIQEKLVGQEVSVMAFCDGTRTIPLVAAQDYKRIYDGNRGPNTGGMGGVAPAAVGVPILKEIHALLTRTVLAMKQESLPYHGILYGGMMIVGGTPYFLEFNCRFGDPETQAQLPLLETDLYPILHACATGSLKSNLVRWSQKNAVCVVAVSKGYPGDYVTGYVINGSNTVENAYVFHAGTVGDSGRMKTNGGRILGVVALGVSQEQARKIAYDGMEKISFRGMQFRNDIGKL